jgi:hypothetical protein
LKGRNEVVRIEQVNGVKGIIVIGIGIIIIFREVIVKRMRWIKRSGFTNRFVYKGKNGIEARGDSISLKVTYVFQKGMRVSMNLNKVQLSKIR